MKLTEQQKADLFDLIDANLEAEIDEPDYEVGQGAGAHAFLPKEGMAKLVTFIEELK